MNNEKKKNIWLKSPKPRKCCHTHNPQNQKMVVRQALTSAKAAARQGDCKNDQWDMQYRTGPQQCRFRGRPQGRCLLREIRWCNQWKQTHAPWRRGGEHLLAYIEFQIVFIFVVFRVKFYLTHGILFCVFRSCGRIAAPHLRLNQLVPSWQLSDGVKGPGLSGVRVMQQWGQILCRSGDYISNSQWIQMMLVYCIHQPWHNFVCIDELWVYICKCSRQ